MSNVEGNSEWLRQFHENKAFLDTDAGKLFGRFEHTLCHAMQVDCSERASDATMRKAWDASHKARSEFVAALKALQAKAESAP